MDRLEWAGKQAAFMRTKKRLRKLVRMTEAQATVDAANASKQSERSH